MSEVTYATIREQLAAAHVAKDTLKSFERLESNRDYRKLIKDGFMGSNMIRQIGNSVEVGFDEPEVAKYALGEAQAGGYLKRYLEAEKAQLRQLVGTIPKLEAALAEEDQAEAGHDLDEEEDDSGEQE